MSALDALSNGERALLAILRADAMRGRSSRLNDIIEATGLHAATARALITKLGACKLIEAEPIGDAGDTWRITILDRAA